MTQLQAGQVVIVDWRDALPKEPNKQRPAIVVEDSDLFDPAYPNVLLVPLADDPRLAIADLALTILPTAENGCPKPCYALAHHVTATSKHRVSATSSNITQAQLTQIRKLIAIAIGLG
jgi:mRNA-degrading endonuclease toxin of MazEF toxin-antitoxin module